MKNEIRGFVRWFDSTGDDGIITDFDGNEWYFNSWSFERTRYRVTGVCKKTKRKKTIETRHYPGLFLQHSVTKDPILTRITHDVPVTFENANIGEKYLWAVGVVPDFSRRAAIEVWEYRLVCVLDSLLATEFDFKSSWHEYYEKRLEALLMRGDSL